MVALLLLIEFDRLSFYCYTTQVFIQLVNQSVSVLARTLERVGECLKCWLKKRTLRYCTLFFESTSA
jgi:hypothetical protein